MVLFVNSNDSSIYATNYLVSKEEIKNIQMLFGMMAIFLLSKVKKKRVTQNYINGMVKNLLLNIYLLQNLSLSQLDRIEEQLGKSQDEIRQEGADMVMEELVKRGLIV